MAWWETVRGLEEELGPVTDRDISPLAQVDPDARISGSVHVGEGTTVGRGATILGPVRIGRHCLIGNNAFVRGPTRLDDGCRIGFGTEIKRATLGRGVMVGPLCFVADSVVEDDAFLGALVRTSNVLLNGETVRVWHEGVLVDTCMCTLGAHIGRAAKLGVGVVILPGRSVPAGTVVGAGIIVRDVLVPGQYVLEQTVRYDPLGPTEDHRPRRVAGGGN